MSRMPRLARWTGEQTAIYLFGLLLTGVGTFVLPWILKSSPLLTWLIWSAWIIAILIPSSVFAWQNHQKEEPPTTPYVPPHILSELEGQLTHFESKIELFGVRVDASKLATPNPTLTLYLDLYSSALYALIVKGTEGQVMVGDQLLAYPPQQDTSNRPRLNYSYRATLVLLQPLNPEAADEISRMARDKKWVEFRLDKLRLVLAGADPAISSHVERHFVPLSQTHYVDGSGWPQRKLASGRTS